MTQFFVTIGRGDLPDTAPLRVDSSLKIPALDEVADMLGCSPGHVAPLVGPTGCLEPLVDRLHFTIAAGESVDADPFLQSIARLTAARIPFVCWYGSDVTALPVATSGEDARRMLVGWATDQPPELYLLFQPHETGRAVAR